VSDDRQPHPTIMAFLCGLYCGAMGAGILVTWLLTAGKPFELIIKPN
jgi:hypothetical protein